MKPAVPPHRMRARALAGSALLVLAGCGSQPPAPQWQREAHGAAERAVQAYFEGRERVEQAEFDRARAALSRTGDPAQLARLELLRCAAQIASLDTAPCERFAALAADANPAEQAYARYLEGRASAADVALLPEAQRAAATASGAPLAAAVAAQPDPLARLVAAGAGLVRGEASPSSCNWPWTPPRSKAGGAPCWRGWACRSGWRSAPGRNRKRSGCAAGPPLRGRSPDVGRWVLLDAEVEHHQVQPVVQGGQGVRRLGGDVGQQLRRRGNECQRHRQGESGQRMLGGVARRAAAFHGGTPGRWGRGVGRPLYWIAPQARLAVCQTNARPGGVLVRSVTPSAGFPV